MVLYCSPIFKGEKMVVPYGIELYKYASDEGIVYLLGNSLSKE